MADKGSEFLVFLQANYPDDYAKLSTDKVDDALINTIFEKHKEKFDLWSKVPDWLRGHYGNRVPDAVLQEIKRDGVVSGEDFNKIQSHSADPIINLSDYGYNDSEIANISFSAADREAIKVSTAAIIQKGYSSPAAQELATYKQIIKKQDEKLRKLQEVEGPTAVLSDEERALRHKTKEKIVSCGRKDHKRNQPERFLVYTLKRVNRKQMDMETALPQLDQLFKMVKETGREEALQEYLQLPQSGTKHFKEETQSLLYELAALNNVSLSKDNSANRVQEQLRKVSKMVKRTPISQQSDISNKMSAAVASKLYNNQR